MYCNNASTQAAAVEMEKRRRYGWMVKSGIRVAPGKVGLGREKDYSDCRDSEPGIWENRDQRNRNVDRKLFLKIAGGLSMFDDRKVRGKI